jgi:glycosyltransferase involved in cell wall biosynthesis
MAVYMNVLRKYSKAKIILRAHNVEYLIWERHLASEKGLLKKWYLTLQTKRLKKFEKQVCDNVDAIISITDVDKKTLLEFSTCNKIVTCITGINLIDYLPSKENAVTENTMFIFSSMDWMPNIEAVNWFLKNCFEKILVAVPSCKLVIAGRNMPKNILELANSNIEIVENVKDAKQFYQKHSIMLVPLLSGSGLRIKIIEGMAYGKAIVSTSIGAEGIKAISGEHLVLADSPEAFSIAVIQLLKNQVIRKDLEKNARKFAEEFFDNKRVVQELLEFYKTLYV